MKLNFYFKLIFIPGLPYRVRLLGADQCTDCLMILLDDLERTFEGEEDLLTTSCLKLCLTSSPARCSLNPLLNMREIDCYRC